GANDDILIGDNGLPTGKSARTVAGWVKIDANGTGDNTLLFYGDKSEGKGFWLGIDGMGELEASGYGDNNASHAFDANGTNLRDGNWHHVAFTTDANQTAKLFVDGVLAGTKAGFNINTTAPGYGNYHVVVGNPAGSQVTSSAATVTVIDPVVITSHPTDTNATVGGTVSFEVNATGTEPLSYQWQKNGVDINGSTAATLTLANVQGDANGTYRVVVSNSLTSTTSNGATLAVGPGLKLWEFATGNILRSSLAIGADGTIYVGSYDNKLYALNSDGTKKWEFETSGPSESAPAIGADGTVYVGSQDDKLYALNSDGTKKWEFATGGNIHSSPAIGANGVIYFGSEDNKVYALNSDGTKKWEFPALGRVQSSPSIGPDGVVYIGSNDNKVYALNPDGSKKWSFATGGDIGLTSPAIGSDGTIYIGSSDNKLYALNPDGTKKWEFATGGNIRSSPAIGANGTVYIGSMDNNLYAINPGGSVKWQIDLNGSLASSPAIGIDDTIYIGGNDGIFRAIDKAGIIKWQNNIGAQIIYTAAVVSDGTIYFGADDNKLYALSSSSMGLADSPWPKFGQNNQNTHRSRLADGLIAYYPFNGNAKDESG
ncbi:MAG: PQQ-binding-like beta-propeller repeat protein, partial [Verrucomicrobiota bacterium]|nr:PQQ-binding-like beta-propeller repeat protein [Verrucomicrobiota bacterium]